MNNARAVSDVPFLIISFFSFFIFIVLFGMITNDVTNAINQTGLINTSTGIGAFNDSYVTVFDGIAVMTVIILSIAVILVGFQLNVGPAFYLFGGLALIFLIIVAGFLSESWGTFERNEAVSSEFTQFGMISFFMNNFPLLILALSMIGVIVLYAKRS